MGKVVQARAGRGRQGEAMPNATAELAWEASDYHTMVGGEDDAMSIHSEDTVYFVLRSARFVIHQPL